MSRKIPISTNEAPPSRGTHSQAVRAGGFLFVTMQTGRDPRTETMADGVEAQTRMTLANVAAILEEAGCSPADLVRVTLLMADLGDFKAIDELYAAWLPPREAAPYPARTAFAAKDLPAGALVALEATALLPDRELE